MIRVIRMTLTEARGLINCDPLNAAQPQTWFDLGCGSGLFSEALSALLAEGSLIYAIDKRRTTFNDNKIKFLQLDFLKDALPAISVNGILMANALHYVRDQLQFLTWIKSYLSTSGVFLLVEYNTEVSNQWVPYPISLLTAQDLFKQAGFESSVKIAERPALYNNRGMYSALFYNLRK